MKKILPVLIIGLMFAFSVKAAEEVKTTVLYKLGDKTISYRNGYDKHDQSFATILINGKEVPQIEQENFLDYVYNGESSYSLEGKEGMRGLYKTSQKNIIVFFEEKGPYEALDGLKTWRFFDVSKNKDVAIMSEAAYVNNTLYDQDFIKVNGLKILSDIDDKGCSDDNLAGKNKNEAKKYVPVFSRFFYASDMAESNNILYSSKNNSPLACNYFVGTLKYGMDEAPHFVASSIDFKMLGVNSTMSLAYFSGTGKGWTAYYAYDIKAMKITKTTLAKINKDKIKLTLVKKF